MMRKLTTSCAPPSSPDPPFRQRPPSRLLPLQLPCLRPPASRKLQLQLGHHQMSLFMTYPLWCRGIMMSPCQAQMRKPCRPSVKSMCCKRQAPCIAAMPASPDPAQVQVSSSRLGPPLIAHSSSQQAWLQGPYCQIGQSCLVLPRQPRRPGGSAGRSQVSPAAVTHPLYYLY